MGADTDAACDVECLLSLLNENVDSFFKKVRGLYPKVWPPLADRSEEEASALILMEAETRILEPVLAEWKQLRGSSCIDAEGDRRARSLFAARCEKGLSDWKRFVLLCQPKVA